MRIEKVDLGLSLSLSFPQKNNQPSSPQLNLMPFSDSSSLPACHDTFASSDRNSETCRLVEPSRLFLKGIDVNRLPSRADCEEEAGVSSPNSTVSSVSGKRSEREPIGDEHEQDVERASSRGVSDEEDVETETSRKKLRLNKDQSFILEESFKEHHTLNPKQKMALAKQLGLRPRQVEVWFQNRRARTKLKQTEVDCDFLKRCCENLTDENRRLQKEVQELRALKRSPQFCMQMTPPTTLTMCHSCERVGVPPSGPSSSAVDPRANHQLGQARFKPISISPWASSAERSIAHPPFEILNHHRPFKVSQPRS